MAGFVLFALLRSGADDTGIGVKGQYVVDLERRLFGGTLPTKWLQDRLYHPGQIGVVAVVCTVVYFSYFVVVHIVALTFWRRNPTEFKRYAFAVLLVVYAGLAVSFLVPTAPPWLASEHSNAPAMVRIVAEVLGSNPEGAGHTTAGVNAFAAMPSLHFAVTVLVALALWRRRRLRPAAVLYLAAMGFTLVYGGEHYVVDLPRERPLPWRRGWSPPGSSHRRSRCSRTNDPTSCHDAGTGASHYRSGFIRAASMTPRSDNRNRGGFGVASMFTFGPTLFYVGVAAVASMLLRLPFVFRSAVQRRGRAVGYCSHSWAHGATLYRDVWVDLDPRDCLPCTGLSRHDVGRQRAFGAGYGDAPSQAITF